MNQVDPFLAGGRWFRGNCHTHTTLSDGDTSAEKIVQLYRAKGYDFLVLTDHMKAQKNVKTLQRKGFLVINGIEVHPKPLRNEYCGYHIVGIGVDKSPSEKWIKSGSASRAIRWIKRQGGIATYGHPHWLGHDVNDLLKGRETLGVEVFNNCTEAMQGLGDSSVHFDQALSAGIRWTAFAVDDTHQIKRDTFGGWIMVKATALTKAAIMQALRRGSFYATCGPQIRSLGIRGRIARVTCSPVKAIVWHGEGPSGVIARAGRGLLTKHEFNLKDLSGTTRYLRVEIIDAKGRKAWSNPIFARGMVGPE